MRFTIITICLNEERHIEKTMKSVFEQSFHDYEHIIEDGGSKDRTLSIVKEQSSSYYENQLRVYSEKDYGLYDAMNRAVNRAEGEYICFLNSGDTFISNDVLQKVNQEIIDYPNADIFYGISMMTFENDDRLDEMRGIVDATDGDVAQAILSSGEMKANHQAMFSDRSCFRSNMFDTTYELRAEMKWFYECLAQGRRLRRMPFPVTRYLFGGMSEKSSSRWIDIRERKKILTEYGIDDNVIEADYRENAVGAYMRLNVYQQWLGLLQAGRSVSCYCYKNGFQSVAVYGYSRLGSQLVNELRNKGIKVEYIVDRCAYYEYYEIPVLSPDSELKPVDVMIVTSLSAFREIEREMKKRYTFPIVSLEDAIERAWE